MAGVIGTNRLTAAKVRAFAKSGPKDGQPKKLTDGGGLYVAHTKAGTAVWRMKYRLGTYDGTLSIGTVAEVSLEAAREARDAARQLVKKGLDPVDHRRVKRAAAAAAGDLTFEGIAQQWFEKNRRDWSDIHYHKSQEAFKRDVLPVIGKLPINEITSAIIGTLVERILERDVRETASKVLQHVVSVFRFAKAKGLCADNPATDARELIPKKRIIKAQPALLDIEALREVLRKADVANISPAVRWAQRLCAFSAQRIGPVVMAEWSEFDLDSETPKWIVPRKKMKMRHRVNDHIVYLGPTIAAELRAWRDRIGQRGYVFPSAIINGKHPHIQRETLEKVYRVTLGLADVHTLHGWRSAFSTLASESKLFPKDAIEMALDHVHDTAVVRAYDRGERLPDRVQLAVWWDAMLNPPTAGVIPISAARTA
jgi:integrase